MTKQYVTWTPYKIEGKIGSLHPDVSINERWNKKVVIHFTANLDENNHITVREPEEDGNRYLGILTYDNTKVLAPHWEQFDKGVSMFEFKNITSEEALAYANAWYPVKEEHAADFPNGYFELVNGEIINNKPQQV